MVLGGGGDVATKLATNGCILQPHTHLVELLAARMVRMVLCVSSGDPQRPPERVWNVDSTASATTDTRFARGMDPQVVGPLTLLAAGLLQRKNTLKHHYSNLQSKYN
jgi:hypothetical protein